MFSIVRVLYEMIGKSIEIFLRDESCRLSRAVEVSGLGFHGYHRLLFSQRA
jgi:hypothetical protein